MHKYIILVINGWFCIRFLIDSMLVVEGLICADNNGFQISIIYKCCSFITKRMQENETIMVTYNHTQQHELLHKPRSLQQIIPQRNSERSVYRVVPPYNLYKYRQADVPVNSWKLSNNQLDKTQYYTTHPNNLKTIKRYCSIYTVQFYLYFTV
jgi:hypothetical protein